MFRGFSAVWITAALVIVTCASAFATPTPTSGTLSPLNPSLTFSDGPFTGANPTNNVPGSNGPNCSAVPNTCSDYLLTVSIPAGYSALHPNDVVTVKVQWPDATVNDFDLYILDPTSGAEAQPGSQTNADPEIAPFHFTDGTVTYRVRVAVFQAANESYVATVTLGPPSAGTPLLAHSYSVGMDQWSCNTHLNATNPTGPPPTLDQNLDGEPLTAFDANGRFYISALSGLGGGCGVWYSDDACGQAQTFVGTPDAGIGGGDAEIKTAPEKNALGFYNVYTSSLSLANITTAVSFDGGNTFLLTPISSYTPVLDRNWNATYGPSICYLSFVNGATQPGNAMEVVRMDYSGLAAPVISPNSVVWDPVHVDPNLPHQKGNLVTDKRPGANTALLMAGPNGEGNVYCCWTENGQRVFCSVSTDFGTTWTHHLIWDGGIGANYSHIFTWMAVDNAGNLYNVFSDDRNIYLCASTDHGVTWTTPVRVNRGSGTSNSCIFPQIVAGSPGHIAICFYGTSDTSPHNATAEWEVYVARSDNALLQAPDFNEVKVNDKPFHTGAVCENGLNCTSGRELSDNFDLDVNPVDGGLGLAYGVFAVSGSFMARQVSGIGLYTDKIMPDRSASCPTPVNGCKSPAISGSPCLAPDYVTVVTDPTGTADTPPVAMGSEDIVSVGVGEPVGVGNSLVFTMKMASLDPTNLPPNVFWRVIWTGPGGQRYVDVVNCATGGLSSHYGHFTTGNVEDGPSDGFTVSADGHITVTINKSKVDNPGVGTTLNAINADCRTIAGTCPVTGAAVYAPNDVTNSGQYVVVGNDYCGATPTLAERFSATAAANGVDLAWSAGAGVTLSGWNVYRAASATGPFVRLTATPIAFAAGGSFAWHDTPGSGTFSYRLAGVRADGSETIVSTTSVRVGPVALAIQAAGNPFRNSTTLRYAVPARSRVRIEVFNVAGQRVRTLVDGDLDAGAYEIPFSLRGSGQSALPVGVYLARVTAGRDQQTVRLIGLQ